MFKESSACGNRQAFELARTSPTHPLHQEKCISMEKRYCDLTAKMFQRLHLLPSMDKSNYSNLPPFTGRDEGWRPCKGLERMWGLYCQHTKGSLQTQTCSTAGES